MPHLSQVSEDCFAACSTLAPIGVHYVTGEILRTSVAYGYRRHSPVAGSIFGEEVVSTYGCTIRRLQVGMHPFLTSVASRVFVLPLSSCGAALTSRVVWDMCKAMGTEFFKTHTVRELSCLGNSPLHYFFLLIIDPHHLILLIWRISVPLNQWAYRIYTSVSRLSLR